VAVKAVKIGKCIIFQSLIGIQNSRRHRSYNTTFACEVLFALGVRTAMTLKARAEIIIFTVQLRLLTKSMNSTLHYRFNSWNRFQVLCLALGFHTEFCQSSVGARNHLKPLTGRGVETIPTTLTNVHLGLKVRQPRGAAVGGTKVSCSGNAAIAQCRKARNHRHSTRL